MSARGKGGNGNAKRAIHKLERRRALKLARRRAVKLARRRAVKQIVSGIIYDGTSGVLTVHLEDVTKNAAREYARRNSIDFVFFRCITNLPGRHMGHPIVVHIQFSDAAPGFRYLASKLASLGALRDIRIRSTKFPSCGSA